MNRITPLPRLLLGMLLLAACSSSSTAPELVRDLDTARERWTAAGFNDYRFDYRIVTAWFPPGPYYRVTVESGRVTSVRDAGSGALVPQHTAETVDEIWERLLRAREQSESLTDLVFDGKGVPRNAMIGSFANDGGLLYQIRAFVPAR